MLKSLHTQPLPQVEDFDGEVVALLGKHDPVVRVEDSIETWRKIFPQTQFKVVDAGHFLHLELPPEAWFGHP